jgi:hypothetical protein
MASSNHRVFVAATSALIAAASGALGGCESLLDLSALTVADAGTDGEGNASDGATETAGVGVLGAACATNAALACSGHAQGLSLICADGVWKANQSCPLGQLCNTAPGPNQGACAPVDPACGDAGAGEQSCGSATEVVRCGIDRVSSTPVETCSGQACLGGACGGECMPGAARCLGFDGLQTCDGTGQWGAPTSCMGQPCCDGACTTNDAHNCGACGHDCQGGSCSGNACGSVTIASNLTYPTSIAVSGTTAFFIDGETINSVPLDGGTVSVLLDRTNLDTLSNIAADSKNVYWIEQTCPEDGGACGSTIEKMSLNGGTATPLVSGPNAGAMAIDANRVYWTTLGQSCPSGGGACPNNGTVLSAPLLGGATTTLATGQGSPAALAVNATSVVWVTTTDSAGDGAVLSVPIAGGTPTTLASTCCDATTVAVDAQNVYYANFDDVLETPLLGGAATTLFSTSSIEAPTSLSVDSSGVYWLGNTFSTAGKVDQTAIGGGQSTLIIGNTTQYPSALALTGSSVVWTQYANIGGPASGQVMRAVKP